MPFITNERSERSSYYQSYKGRLVDIHTALKRFKRIGKNWNRFYNHFRTSSLTAYFSGNIKDKRREILTQSLFKSSFCDIKIVLLNFALVGNVAISVNSTLGQFHLWKIPAIRAPTTETTYKGIAKYAVDANLFRLGNIFYL